MNMVRLSLEISSSLLLGFLFLLIDIIKLF
jgi:hypothetical protein